jgi:hypothetical protein
MIAPLTLMTIAYATPLNDNLETTTSDQLNSNFYELLRTVNDATGLQSVHEPFGLFA